MTNSLALNVTTGGSTGMIVMGVTTVASLLIITNRTARYCEADVPPTALMHGLWVQSTEWCEKPFPEECGICQTIEVISTAIIKITGEIVGGLVFLIFLIERVWHMVFGPSESEQFAQQIASQKTELQKLAGVQALSAQFLQALGQAVAQSKELAQAVQDSLQTNQGAQVRQNVSGELAMIDQVLDAVIAKAEQIAASPDRQTKMDAFKAMLHQRVQQIDADTQLVQGMGDRVEEVVGRRETAANGLERFGQRVEESLAWMTRSLVEILVPKTD